MSWYDKTWKGNIKQISSQLLYFIEEEEEKEEEEGEEEDEEEEGSLPFVSIFYPQFSPDSFGTRASTFSQSPEMAGQSNILQPRSRGHGHLATLTLITRVSCLALSGYAGSFSRPPAREGNVCRGHIFHNVDAFHCFLGFT